MKWEFKKTGKIIYTDRDIGIINGKLNGKSDKEIANEYNVSDRTIEQHRYRLWKFFRARSDAEMVLMAYIHGVIEYTPPKI